MLILSTGVTPAKIAEEMLCIERGEKNGQPWPIIEIPPQTKHGEPALATYKASVGIVFFHADCVAAVGSAASSAASSAATDNVAVKDLIENIRLCLDRESVHHLRKSRAIAATPQAVVRRAPELDETSREIILAAEYADTLPDHYGSAVFTWHFLPIHLAFALSRSNGGVRDMAEFNAIVASIVVDMSQMLHALNNTYINRSITLADYDIPRPPEASAARETFFADDDVGTLIFISDTRLPDTPALEPRRRKNKAAAPRGPRGPGTFKYIRQPKYLGPDWVSMVSTLATVDYDAAYGVQCKICKVPTTLVHDVAVVLLDCIVPIHDCETHKMIDYWPPETEGTPFTNCLLCAYCWAACDNYCVRRHLRATVAGTVVPATAVVLEFAPLMPFIDAQVTPIADAPGAFVVRPRGGGAPLIVTGDQLGPCPYFTNSEIYAAANDGKKTPSLEILTNCNIRELV